MIIYLHTIDVTRTVGVDRGRTHWTRMTIIELCAKMEGPQFGPTSSANITDCDILSQVSLKYQTFDEENVGKQLDT